MSIRPGVTVTTSAAASAATPGERLGTFFVAAQTQRGPLVPDQTAPLRSLADFTNLYGGRDATLGSVAITYDAVEAYFRTGGAALLVSRVVGPAAVTASLTLVDRAGSPLNTLLVKAKGPGVWANTHLKVAVANGATTGTFALSAVVDNIVVETSPDLASPTEAVTWGGRSQYFTIADLACATVAPNNNPAVLAASSLTSGVDDLGSVTDTHWTAALNAMPAQWGPGLVAKLGVTTAAGHAGTVAHAAACKREALLDGTQGASQSTMTTLAQTVQAAAGAPEFGMVFAPWLTIPPFSGGVANRYIAPSAAMAGLISAQVTGGLANRAAAGANGQLLWVLDTAPATSGAQGQTFTDTELDALNGSAPVNVIKRAYSASAVPPLELYGYATLAVAGNGWRQGGPQLLRLRLTDEIQLLAEQFIFQQLDGRNHTIAAFGGAIAGVLHGHWENDELFGPTPSQAYQVDVVSVNTPVTLAAGQLNARVNIRVSPTADYLTIDIVKVAVNQSL